jgi:hypothetical protein
MGKAKTWVLTCEALRMQSDLSAKLFTIHPTTLRRTGHAPIEFDGRNEPMVTNKHCTCVQLCMYTMAGIPDDQSSVLKVTKQAYVKQKKLV